jgi:hypothetical protein
LPFLRKTLRFNWLPRMDSNHDKVIQSHLCYRYTTRQCNYDIINVLRNSPTSIPESSRTCLVYSNA